MHDRPQMLSSDAADRRLPSAIQLVLLGAIQSDCQGAYGTALTKKVELVARRPIADAQIYVMLQRLEDRGLIEASTRVPEPSAKGRGRPRKYYSVTEAGRRVLEIAGSYASAISSLTPLKEGAGNEHKAQGHLTPLVV